MRADPDRRLNNQGRIMPLCPNDQAAIAFDALLTFMVKADLCKEGRDRLLGLVMEAWEDCDDTDRDREEAALFDAARAWVFYCEKVNPKPKPIIRHHEFTSDEGHDRVRANQ
jgi:hypothetical protein